MAKLEDHWKLTAIRTCLEITGKTEGEKLSLGVYDGLELAFIIFLYLGWRSKLNCSKCIRKLVKLGQKCVAMIGISQRGSFSARGVWCLAALCSVCSDFASFGGDLKISLSDSFGFPFGFWGLEFGENSPCLVSTLMAKALVLARGNYSQRTAGSLLLKRNLFFPSSLNLSRLKPFGTIGNFTPTKRLPCSHASQSALLLHSWFGSLGSYGLLCMSCLKTEEKEKSWDGFCVLFRSCSGLTPGTCLKPHCGPTNLHLTCHLGLQANWKKSNRWVEFEEWKSMASRFLLAAASG